MAIVQFSHANGFPAGSYRTFLDCLRAHVTVRAVERIGMDARFPVTSGWPGLLAQLVEEIAACAEPPILLGHSLGGILSMQAAYQPGVRVRAVVMIDAPIMGARAAQMFALMKLLRIDDRISPARLTRTRRASWPSRSAAREHFAARALFAEFDSRALDDYIDAGLVEDAQGVTLAIDRAIETRIYRTFPHHLHRLARKPQPVPFGFLGGTRSRELAQIGPASSRRFFGSQFRWFEGGHLLPMERPEAAAAQVMALFAALGALDDSSTGPAAGLSLAGANSLRIGAGQAAGN